MRFLLGDSPVGAFLPIIDWRFVLLTESGVFLVGFG
jgi:hypothetical protein